MKQQNCHHRNSSWLFLAINSLVCIPQRRHHLTQTCCTNADRNKQICSDKMTRYETLGDQHNHYAAAVSHRKVKSIICSSKWHRCLHHISTFHTQCWSDKSGYDDVSNSWLHCYWYPWNVWKHQQDITCIPSRLAPHNMTGCNTMATYFGFCKVITLKSRAGIHTLRYKQTRSKHNSGSAMINKSC